MEKLRSGTMACVVLLLWVATATSSPAQNYKSIVKFRGTNGELPYGSLVQGKDGNLYGTTFWGGDSNLVCELGCGTVFKITPAGRLTVLHRFRPAPHCPKGGVSGPAAGLVQSVNGNFYGTTEFGGNCAGTVFEMTPLGRLTTIYSFGSQGNDGQQPESGLVQSANGDFYGTTSLGGTYGEGTVFKITPAGKLTILYSFCHDSYCTDGAVPHAGLTEGADGSFYGTTAGGGTNSFRGVVFNITPTGKFTVLYSFCSKMNCADGDGPLAALMLGRDGSFYGTTLQGGNASDSGTVFKITPSGQLTTLYSFCSKANCPDGSDPWAGLVQGLDGDFYGATIGGGLSECPGVGRGGCGTVFKITPTGKLTTLHRFSSGSDGRGPVGTLLRATNYFYGSTLYGGVGCPGALGCGTVFRIRP